MIVERRVASPDDGTPGDRVPGDGLVAASSPRSDAAEAYRTLATNIQFSSLDRPVRTLLVTGATPDEDKTTVLPSSRTILTSARMNSRLASGSRLATGSSRSNTGAHVARARAKAT